MSEMPSARRQSAKIHLQRAAKAELGSVIEQYHLEAAQAEALYDIAESLALILNLLRNA